MPKTFTPPQAVETTPRPPIALVRVKSHQVAAIGYSDELKIQPIQFQPRKGETEVAVYHYERTTEQHAAFIGADSIGTHFGIHLKPLPFKRYPAEPLPALESTE